MIPSYLMSGCADIKFDLCYGCCNSVKQNQDTGRWFITMGHPGFNTTTNNRDGYASREDAVRVVNRLSGGKGRAR